MAGLLNKPKKAKPAIGKYRQAANLF